jgi:hypothetical protein
MQWYLKSRTGKTMAAGTLEQMLTYLKYLVPDGEYQLVGSELTIRARRHRGLVYPLEEYIAEMLSRKGSKDSNSAPQQRPHRPEGI